MSLQVIEAYMTALVIILCRHFLGSTISLLFPVEVL
jgi:hypothetical protein